jgi:hypothetical protein
VVPEDRRTRAARALERLIRAGEESVRTAYQETPEQAAYREAFEAEAHAAPVEAVDVPGLADRLAPAPAILCGAFHTCPEVPRALAKLLRATPVPEGGEVVQVPIASEDLADNLDAYAAGHLDLDELLDGLDDVSEWPFAREAYAPLLEAARERGAALVGHGVVSPGSPPRRRAEADVAALMGAWRPDQGQRAWVVAGEHHLAAGHLPAALAEASGQEGDRFPRLVHSAWPAFLEGEEELDAPAAARLESGLWAVFAAAPYRLFESFDNWRHGTPEVPWPLRAPWRTEDEPDLAVTLDKLARGLGEALELELPPGRPWGRALTPEDLDELVALPFDDAALDELLGQLSQGRGYFLPSVPAVVLPGAAGGPVVEEVAHAWNFACSPREGELPPADDLRARVLREAVGFYGSLVLVPDRPFWDPDQEDAPAGTPLGRAQAALRAEMEDGVLCSAGTAEALWREDVEAYLALAHLVGYLLGGTWDQDPETAETVMGFPGEDLEASWRRALELAGWL